MQTKVAHGYDQTFDFADSLVLDYYFEGNSIIMQSGKS